MYLTNTLPSALTGNPDVRYLVLIRQIWHRGRATVAQRVPVAPSIPLEVVEMIIAHLIYDKYTLMACSLTGRSWYIASVPHLHHTLVIKDNAWGRCAWPKPLQKGNKLGLLPLVKKLRLCRSSTSAWRIGFLPVQFDHDARHQISGLTNIRELDIADLDIPAFMPKIQKYLGHFLPRLQSLSLREPLGSNRQIIFFIGLFQRLEDLTLHGTSGRFWKDMPYNDPALIPPSTPPLRGQLTIMGFCNPRFLEEMIQLFGRIQFRRMALWFVGEPQPLLNACAETLETVQLWPFDPGGEQSRSKHTELLANDTAACSPPFDLSKNKSLRTLEVVTWPLLNHHGFYLQMYVASTVLKTILSTITSPTFSEILIFPYGYWTRSGPTCCTAFHPYRKPDY